MGEDQPLIFPSWIAGAIESGLVVDIRKRVTVIRLPNPSFERDA